MEGSHSARIPFELPFESLLHRSRFCLLVLTIFDRQCQSPKETKTPAIVIMMQPQEMIPTAHRRLAPTPRRSPRRPPHHENKDRPIPHHRLLLPSSPCNSIHHHISFRTIIQRMGLLPHPKCISSKEDLTEELIRMAYRPETLPMDTCRNNFLPIMERKGMIHLQIWGIQ